MIPSLFREPWCITEQGLQTIVAIATRDQFFSEVREAALEARKGEPLQNTRTVETRNGVAVVPVVGPMFRHADLFSEISGATSYATLRKDLQAALDDPKVKSIVLNIDSVGGEVNGISELASAVRAARGKKPLVAYIGGYGASAAYWLASACDEIVISDTAVLGSIGVMAVYLDEKKKQEAAGEREIRVISSQSPFKNVDPGTDEGLARVQARVDEMSGVFVDAVARNRGITPAAVLSDFGQGDVMVGQRAVDAGLADRISNFEAVLADLVNQQGAFMQTMKASLGLSEEATDKQANEAAVEGVQAKKDLAALITALGAKDADDARGKAAAVVAAHAELATIRAARDAEAKATTQRDLRAALEAAHAGGRLTLGQITKVIPTMLDEEASESVAKALSGVEKQDVASLIGAVCSAQASPRALTRVKAFLEAQGPVAPKAKAEPEHDPEASEVADEQTKEIKAAAAEIRAVLDRNKPKK